MGHRLAIAGEQNTGKSYGRRYIPDGENVMIIQPSIKASHLFKSIPGIEKMTNEEIDKAISSGKRKPVELFSISDPLGKYKSLDEMISLPKDPARRNLEYVLASLKQNKANDYFGDGNDAKKYLTGNVMFCPVMETLQLAIDFVNVRMPWIHTIILPDFTHFVSEAITDDVFLSRKANGEQYTKYLDLAAQSLRGFIKSSDPLRKELVVVTEYHATWVQEREICKLFLPGGKMFEEKFLPPSYYDTMLFTDVKYNEENEEAPPEYRFITRKTKMYPEARSLGNYPDLYIPNDLQDALTKMRSYNDISLN